MKCGVLRFGYEHFGAFERQLQEKGYYTVNLGDNAQSIAVRHVFRQIGVSDDQVVTVNRDSLATYTGEPVALMMNGVFTKLSFPIPEQVVPIFIGFHAGEEVVRTNVEYFKKHEPVGCRDSATTELMRSNGINAVTTGCLTLALPRRAVSPTAAKLMIVAGWNSTFPSRVLKHIPAPLADTAEFIYHRLPVSSHPLSRRHCLDAERYEADIMAQYRERASLVLTPLHHVCAPCIAMGIPVIVCRNENDARFSFLESLLPIYTPERFSAIDWSPEPVDIDGIRNDLLQLVTRRLAPHVACSS